MNLLKFKWLVIVCLLVGGYTNCAKNSNLLSDSSLKSSFKTASSSDSSFKIEQLGEGDLSVTGEHFFVGKLQQGDGNPTFAQWIPAKSGKTAGVLIDFRAYEDPNWTGQDLDNEWWARGAGAFADVAGAYYDPKTSGPASYAPAYSPDMHYPELAYVYNDISVLVIFGRFFNSDITQGQQDVVNAINFLKTQGNVDMTKIGITGISWGGFASLYGMAATDVTLAAASLIVPMTDASQAFEWAFKHVPSVCTDADKLTQFYSFFDAYRRRIDQSTAAYASDANRYNKYSQSGLPAIKTPMYIAHDSWDTIVPKTMSDSLIKLLPNDQSRHFFHLHTTDLAFNADTTVGHTQLSNEPMDMEAAEMWGRLFIINKLKPGQQRYIDYTADAVIGQFTRVRQMKLAGLDTSFYTPLLTELCDKNITMIEVNGAFPNASGPEALAYLYLHKIAEDEGNSAWSGVNTDNVCNLMKKNESVF